MRAALLVAGVAALLVVANARTSLAQSEPPAVDLSEPPAVDLVVNAGRPLRVALDGTNPAEARRSAGDGMVIEPVYAYDRIVIAVGTKVRGHVVQIDSGSKFVRARAYIGGNFSPPKHAVLQFDTLLLDDGHEMPIDTVVKGGIPNVTRKVAGGQSQRGRRDESRRRQRRCANPDARDRARAAKSGSGRPTPLPRRSRR